jgi:hypothetical protein
MNAPIHPYLAAPSTNEVLPAIVALAAVIIGVGAIPGPLVWLMNLSAVPVLLVGIVRFPYAMAPETAWQRLDYVHMRIVLQAAWISALLHHLLHP